MEKNYLNKVFLTFDTDWCTDKLLDYTYNIIKTEGVKATILCTNTSPLLSELLQDNNIEIGIHPNFMKLLNGEQNSDFKEVIKEMHTIFPKAITSRSHALVQNSTILKELYENGFKFELSTYIPFNSGITLKPYLNYYKIVQVPFFYEDDIYCLDGKTFNVSEYFADKNSIKVFNFHPIHIFLNTEDLYRYSNAKPYLTDATKLTEYINTNSKGTKDFLLELIQYCKKNQYEFDLIHNIQI